jgi:hypothetical protein
MGLGCRTLECAPLFVIYVPHKPLRTRWRDERFTIAVTCRPGESGCHGRTTLSNHQTGEGANTNEVSDTTTQLG